MSQIRDPRFQEQLPRNGNGDPVRVVNHGYGAAAGRPEVPGNVGGKGGWGLNRPAAGDNGLPGREIDDPFEKCASTAVHLRNRVGRSRWALEEDETLKRS